jgi:hypothetical protein
MLDDASYDFCNLVYKLHQVTFSLAMHPDSYQGRGQFSFISDHLEDPAITEKKTRNAGF